MLSEHRAVQTASPSRPRVERDSQVSTRTRVAWSRHAACLGRLDLDWIDPQPGQADQCRAVCADCPVRTSCQQFALTHGEPWGIWGGLDPDERAIIALAGGHPPPRALPSHGTNSRYAKHRCRCPPCRHAHTTYEHDRRRRTQCPQ